MRQEIDFYEEIPSGPLSKNAKNSVSERQDLKGWMPPGLLPLLPLCQKSGYGPTIDCLIDWIVVP